MHCGFSSRFQPQNDIQSFQYLNPHCDRDESGSVNCRRALFCSKTPRLPRDVCTNRRRIIATTNRWLIRPHFRSSHRHVEGEHPPNSSDNDIYHFSRAVLPPSVPWLTAFPIPWLTLPILNLMVLQCVAHTLEGKVTAICHWIRYNAAVTIDLETTDYHNAFLVPGGEDDSMPVAGETHRTGRRQNTSLSSKTCS